MSVGSGNGDLEFSNDGGLVSTALTFSVGLSIIAFLVEVCIFLQRKEVKDRFGVEFMDLIPYLLCVHVVAEDVYQALVYFVVWASHSTVPGAVWFGAVQALAFTSIKMYDLCSEAGDAREDGNDDDTNEGDDC